MDDQNDHTEDFVEAQLRYLRGEGPPPDLGALTDAVRSEVVELLDLVEALADSEPTSPPFAVDPLAIRLGLVDASTSVSNERSLDPITVSSEELAFRFGGAAS